MLCKLAYGTLESGWAEEEFYPPRIAAQQASILTSLLFKENRPTRTFHVDEKNPKVRVEQGGYFISVEVSTL